MAGISELLRDARDIIARVSNASTNFTYNDRGGAVVKDDTSAPTYTIPTDATAGWNGNHAILVSNDGASGSVTVSPAGGVTLLNGTTSGSLTLAPGESRTIWRVRANRWRVL